LCHARTNTDCSPIGVDRAICSSSTSEGGERGRRELSSDLRGIKKVCNTRCNLTCTLAPAVRGGGVTGAAMRNADGYDIHRSKGYLGRSLDGVVQGRRTDADLSKCSVTPAPDVTVRLPSTGMLLATTNLRDIGLQGSHNNYLRLPLR